MADRMGVVPGRRATSRWVVRFAAAIMASVALWALFLWVLLLVINWAALL